MIQMSLQNPDTTVKPKANSPFNNFNLISNMSRQRTSHILKALLPDNKMEHLLASNLSQFRHRSKHGSQSKDNKAYLTFTVVFPACMPSPYTPKSFLTCTN